MTGLLMVVMLVIVALVVDIGHTRLVQRQLQAGVDAAALAGALDLPMKAQAEATAKQYSPTPGKKNAVNTIDNATTTATARCITTIPGCDTRLRPVNALSVESTAEVPTIFARIIGINSLTVSAKATACFPCSVRPVDIMIVLDRTGSMCDSLSTRKEWCASGVDLDAAKNGIRSFLLALDPKLDRVGLAVLPPALGPSVHSDVTEDVPPCRVWKKDKWGNDLPHSNPDNCKTWTQKVTQVRNPDSPADACAIPFRGQDSSGNNGRYFGYMAYAPYWRAFDTTLPAPYGGPADSNYHESDRAFYVVNSLSDDDVDNDPSDDYVTKDGTGQWGLNANAPIVNTLDCLKAAGSTSYSLAVDEAAYELRIHGRGPDVPKAIVFFTDGAANTFPNPQANNWPSSGSPWKDRPCGSGVEAAKRAPAIVGSDVAIYTIGYDIDNTSQVCLKPDSNGEQDLRSNPTREVRQTWGQTPKQALQAMASTSANYYQTDDPIVLQQLWGKIAGDVLTNAARLVDNNSPDLMD